MNNTIKAELQHAINMLLEGQDLPLHARLRVMAIQAQLLEIEQLERQAKSWERIADHLENGQITVYARGL